MKQPTRYEVDPKCTDQSRGTKAASTKLATKGAKKPFLL